MVASGAPSGVSIRLVRVAAVMPLGSVMVALPDLPAHS